jgi:hypothetical protein
MRIGRITSRRGKVPLPVEAHHFASPFSIVSKDMRPMMDIVLLGIAVIFFALCFAYTKACDTL